MTFLGPSLLVLFSPRRTDIIKHGYFSGFLALGELCRRLTEGDSNIISALLGSLASQYRFIDAMALAEGYLLMDRCLAALPDGDLKDRVQGLDDRLRQSLPIAALRCLPSVLRSIDLFLYKEL